MRFHRLPPQRPLPRSARRLLTGFCVCVAIIGSLFPPPEAVMPAAAGTLIAGGFMWLIWRMDRDNPRADVRYAAAITVLTMFVIFVIRAFAG